MADALVTGSVPWAGATAAPIYVPQGPLEEKHWRSARYRAVAQDGPLTATHFHVAIATGLGWLIDNLDSGILTLIAPLLIAAFSLSISDFNVGRQLSAFAGILGVFLWPWAVDRFGRRNVLIVNIAMFSLILPFVGLAPSWIWFVGALCILQFALQGEWAAASLLTAETWPAHLRGLVLSVTRSGYALGAGLAGLAVAIAVPIFGWRVAYLLPAVFAAGAIYVRFKCPESPYWVRMQDRKSRIRTSLARGDSVSVEDVAWNSRAERIGLSQLFQPDLLRNTLVASALGTITTIEYSTFISWAPLYLSQERGWTVAEFGFFFFWFGIAGMLGYWLMGWLSDRVGRKWAITIGMVEAAVFLIPWTLTTDRVALWVLALLFHVGFVGIWGPVAAYIAEAFPTRVRGLGGGFAWGIGRVIGLGWPFVVVAIQAATGSFTLAFQTIPVMMGLKVLILWLFSREFAGKKLETITD